MAIGIGAIVGALTAIILAAPLVHDLNQKQPLGTAYANIGKGFSEGISRIGSPQIRPAFLPTIGFKLELPDWLQPR